jgi:hypothetical protein
MAVEGAEEAGLRQLTGAGSNPALSWRGEPLRRADHAPESDGEPTLPLQRGEVARRHVVPEVPEEDDIPEVPRRSNIIVPKEPDGIPTPPDEPDGIPPEPGREPLPEVPPPTQLPERDPDPAPEQPQPEPEQAPPTDLEAVLGPVQGPEPRPDDLPRRPERSLRRPERSDTTSIAELLTEALVAYQETTDEDPEPVPEPVPHERMYFEHTESRPSGRHRMPDWDNGV